MNKLSWIGRCTVLHLLAYLVVALPTGLLFSRFFLQGGEALRFFEFFFVPHLGHLVGQLLRGLVLSLVLLPFYGLLFRFSEGKRVLFWALFGLTIIGSVEPLPASIEGLIYTETRVVEHGFALVVSLLYSLLLTVLLVKAEARFGGDRRREPAALSGVAAETKRDQTAAGAFFLLRFMLLHLFTYLAAGVTFMVLQDYSTAFEASRFFALYRPLDGPIVGTFAVPSQIPRGLLLALWMAPFVKMAIPQPKGWLLIFLSLFGLTALATPGYFPLMATHLAEGGSLANYILVGTPEIFVQMLLFSALLFLWERKRAGKLKAALEGGR